MISVLVLALLPTPAASGPAAATLGPVVTVRQVDEKGFPQIGLEFEVKSATGEPILDAARDEFRVEEDGKAVAVTRFRSPISREFRPTSVVLVLDRSGSMQKQGRLSALKRAVSAFLENQPKGSRVAVVAFGSEVELIQDFTEDSEAVRAAVEALFANGETRYYDAVAAALGLLARETGRRAVLAMTDGDDTASEEADLRSVVLDARRAGLPVHTLAMGSGDEVRPEDVRQLAEDTRGRSFSTRDPADMRAIFEEIARDLGQTYSLSYTTERPIQDGTLRPIAVYYRKAAAAAQAAVYVPGMVVPAAGWSWLFLLLVGGLGALAAVPALLRR